MYKMPCQLHSISCWALHNFMVYISAKSKLWTRKKYIKYLFYHFVAVVLVWSSDRGKSIAWTSVKAELLSTKFPNRECRHFVWFIEYKFVVMFLYLWLNSYLCAHFGVLRTTFYTWSTDRDKTLDVKSEVVPVVQEDYVVSLLGHCHGWV